MKEKLITKEEFEKLQHKISEIYVHVSMLHKKLAPEDFDVELQMKIKEVRYGKSKEDIEEEKTFEEFEKQQNNEKTEKKI